ncbi:MAG TPA: hypothetical protein IAA42_04510 [Candidatus Olsenella excrementavium]|uniref:PTS EIIA type-4 domain-containing protein n=1 Tax=Candidatus Olsenella excrementavium TaxID=2838709 RepID=A0A9D2CI16_9ACTN|nr:hypothetical protein [Candidatus Olsenella excrementavium]
MDVRFIVCGHGMFGTGMHEALRLLCGDDERLSSLDFRAGDSFEDLAERMEGLVDDDVPTVICTDVQGGSPFKASVLVRLKHPNVRAVTGTNFPLLLGLVFPDEEFADVDGLVSAAVAGAREALVIVEVP